MKRLLAIILLFIFVKFNVLTAINFGDILSIDSRSMKSCHVIDSNKKINGNTCCMTTAAVQEDGFYDHCCSTSDAEQESDCGGQCQCLNCICCCHVPVPVYTSDLLIAIPLILYKERTTFDYNPPMTAQLLVDIWQPPKLV